MQEVPGAAGPSLALGHADSYDLRIVGVGQAVERVEDEFGHVVQIGLPEVLPGI